MVSFEAEKTVFDAVNYDDERLDPDISSAWSELDVTHVDLKTDKPLLDSNPDVRKYF
ncbi:hypothetical protein PV433_18170 [Paenibacillus sp. GYB004]|uniref:hypothetical protein n=1 Tax=Paenibacillus sp. GYB004 TaxID=2994393 RepID=UPI002F962B4E